MIFQKITNFAVNNTIQMKKLLSLPPNLIDSFHKITGRSREEYFCTCDPVGHRLGSGGGTAWLLSEAYKADSSSGTFSEWLSREPRILIHAGGQSRRLPSYAVEGKALMPVPVFRWERGQQIGQTLLDLQLPLYEQIMSIAPDSLHTMVVSGDVFIRTTQPLQQIPDADIVCYGLWLDASKATNHGVFLSSRQSPKVLKQMLQKPSIQTLKELQHDNYYLTDIGLWLLSDHAVEILMKRSTDDSNFKSYDLYGEFGCAMGTNPVLDDPEIRALSVAIVPLAGGEFYHFGTSREMISSTLALQNIVNDQRFIIHQDRKPHPSIFVQNSITDIEFTADNTNIWIENSYIGKRWKLSHDNIITGVPENDWEITLDPGECIDVVPVGDSDFEVRRYNIDEAVDSNSVAERANLIRISEQRHRYQSQNLTAMARNWRHSVFYQLDLDDVARRFAEENIPLPPPVGDDAPMMIRIHDAMFRGEKKQAFNLLCTALTDKLPQQMPLSSSEVNRPGDQIVWGRSPVRIDIAGGWTDTPPFCLIEGGSVVNLAIELNGQPPLQAYVKPCHEPHIVIRSIDLGAVEIIDSYDQLMQYNKVGSPFSIPKAALVLAGFNCHTSHFSTLKSHLEYFGSGIELTLLSAVPAGSGLGTSSILAATVLGVLNDFCRLGWDKNEIGHQVLMLEQLLTTGGGWQDQFGGVLGGVKLLQTQPGFCQNPVVRYLPDMLWTDSEYASCHLLYYTGITRTAKQILAEIVRRMFLNQHSQQILLRQMKEHTLEMYDAIQQQDFRKVGLLLRRNWQQNQLLDSGTNPAEIAALTTLVDDLCLGYKLPGAGGGGYLYMIAKDPDAAQRIRQIINDNSSNRNARFVDMTLSKKGMQVSRS